MNRARFLLNFASEDMSLREELTSMLGISDILAQILINRGITNVETAHNFLFPSLDDLLSPYDFKQMRPAIELARKMLNQNKKILIIGDYDVDGIVSTVLLERSFNKLNINKNVLMYLPHRVKEGYGLSKSAVNFIKEKKIDLVITVDCGTNDNDKIRELRRNNIEVIVLDHHQPKENEFLCSFIINPKLEDSGYKFRDLASAGVTFKFCQALLEEPLYEELDLVSLATVADAMPILGENRIIVREGLKRFSQTDKIGLKALLRISGLEDKTLSTYFLGYILAPRLNASGRIDRAEISLQLLLSKDDGEANVLAQRLEYLNSQRQRIENQILEEAVDIIERRVDFKNTKVIVVAREGWHPGVLGIVASKIVERYYRPAVVISLDKEICRGSARSIRSFPIFQALLECKDFLINFGGHSKAAGLTIEKDKIELFEKEINEFAKNTLALEDLIPQLDIDLKVKLSSLNLEIAKEMRLLEPYGEGNPQPLFYSTDLRLKSPVQLLRKNTLKFWVTDGLLTYPVVGFGMGDFKELFEESDHFALVYSLDIDDWCQLQPPSLLLEAKEVFFS